jgi:hypothetical protein
LRIGITLLIILAAILAGFWRFSDTSAEGPVLEISAPQQVEVGQPIELTLVVHNASGIGGYQSRLLFDTSRAHFSGVDHSGNQLAAIGRYIQTLGPNEFDGGVSFGLYSCPVDECGTTGKPVDRGADGELNLVTIVVTPDQPGPFSLELSDLRFSDASGAEVAVEAATRVVVVDVVLGQE